MSLQASAKKIAAEFEYSAEDVQKGVKQFLKQMGEFKREFKIKSAMIYSS